MMGKNNESELINLVLQATWSLEEAAHLTHGVNPVIRPVKLSEKSSDPVVRTFFWLKKELGKGRLYANAEDEDGPRFSPGTLMRHMKDNDRFVNQEVLKIYNIAHRQPGPSGLSADAKNTYLAAADIIWKDYPNMPIGKVAKCLADLPQLFTEYVLPRYSPGTIRKWLMGKGSRKAGRPKSKTKDATKIDLAKVVKKLEKN